MLSIEARITNTGVYSRWSASAGPYLDALKQSRDQACTLLAHGDPIARLGAIESFWHLWHFDEPIARRFLALAMDDCSNLVRCGAASSLMLMHLRCRDKEDRLLLENMLDMILAHDQPVPEIEKDIVVYLENMRVGGDKRLELNAPAVT